MKKSTNSVILATLMLLYFIVMFKLVQYKGIGFMIHM